MWVVDDVDAKLYAYDLATGDHQPNRDINALDYAGNDFPADLWSDGTTIWVTDRNDGKLYAYDLATGDRQADLDFDTLAAAGNQNPPASGQTAPPCGWPTTPTQDLRLQHARQHLAAIAGAHRHRRPAPRAHLHCFVEALFLERMEQLGARTDKEQRELLGN